jgi:glycosyltransferase involved in cell wall biosynthesis
VSAPLVSVVIPCHNSAPYLRQAVASAVAQSLAELEIILVDDGSRDGTAALIRDLIAAHPQRRMRAIFQDRAGVAAARNTGIAAARGRYLLPLDADDLIAPDMARRCSAILDAEAATAIVYGDCEDFGEVSMLWRAGPFALERLKYFNQLAYCAVYRKTAWEAVGGYRSNVDGFDDWDFWIAAAGLGLAGRHVAQAFLRHRRRPDSQMSSIIGDYDRLYARIILNNQAHYADTEIHAARTVMAGGPATSVIRATGFVFMQHFLGNLPPRGDRSVVPCGS